MILQLKFGSAERKTQKEPLQGAGRGGWSAPCWYAPWRCAYNIACCSQSLLGLMGVLGAQPWFQMLALMWCCEWRNTGASPSWERLACHCTALRRSRCRMAKDTIQFVLGWPPGPKATWWGCDQAFSWRVSVRPGAFAFPAPLLRCWCWWW